MKLSQDAPLEDGKRVPRWAKILILAGGALLLIAFFPLPIGGARVSNGVSGFRVRASTDNLFYSSDEAIRVTLTVCRSRILPTRTSSGGGTEVLVHAFVTDDAGEIVYDTAKQIRTSELRSVVWLPGQCRSEVNEWKPPSRRSDDRGSRSVTYKFRLQWLTAVWDSPPGPVEPALTVEATVEDG